VTVDSRRILSRLYPGAWRRRRRRPSRRRRLWKTVRGPIVWLRSNAWPLAAGVLLLVGWVAAHLYYYNMLIDLEFNVQAAWAQVETLQQRRAHIQDNLTPLVKQYGQHERDLLALVARIRTAHLPASRGPARGMAEAADGAAVAPTGQGSGATPAPPGQGSTVAGVQRAGVPVAGVPIVGGAVRATGGASGSLPALQVLAEQYPTLRSTENFQQFSTAVIDAEDRIAVGIQKYNEAVNRYTTVLSQFPSNVFGKVCGFETYEFYAPERRHLKYQPIAR